MNDLTGQKYFDSLTGLFMKLSSAVKDSSAVAEEVNNLYKLFLQYHQEINSEIYKLNLQQRKNEEKINQLIEDKRRLEVLYSSGILFSTETETKALISTAIDTVVRELKADSGFIILTNESGETENIFVKNMHPEDNPEAMEMSTTVIKNTINASSPVRVDNAGYDEELSQRASILKLGITAVLCVPLALGSKVLGAVYIDRRNKENPFTQNDLIFLLAFAKQIVNALEISSEISNLEKRLLTDAIEKFDDLRKEFKCDEIVGSGKKLFDVLKLAAKISPTNTSVIILGENGTGKDVLARVIHNNSKRASKPFVTIDCSAIPADLLESELFGYESGAFTGAAKTKPGKLELADGGTLFFNEIGEMSINLQAKILRVIQTGEIERLGSVNTKKINVRIISATNRNLPDMISKGTFREDLYYRLKVIEINMPPLRERKEDIESLCNHFIKKHGEGKEYKISDEALEVLEEYSFPGNIRELENIILRSIVLATDNKIDVKDLPQEIIQKSSDEILVHPGKKLLEAETEFRRMYIIKTLRKVNSKAEAAKLLGVNRTHFYKLLSQLEIDL